MILTEEAGLTFLIRSRQNTQQISKENRNEKLGYMPLKEKNFIYVEKVSDTFNKRMSENQDHHHRVFILIIFHRFSLETHCSVHYYSDNFVINRLFDTSKCLK